MNNKTEKNSKSHIEELVMLGAYVPRELSDYLDCIITADTHKSKSQILREALEHYIENGLDDDVKKGADAIAKMRIKTLKALKRKEGGIID